MDVSTTYPWPHAAYLNRQDPGPYSSADGDHDGSQTNSELQFNSRENLLVAVQLIP